MDDRNFTVDQLKDQIRCFEQKRDWEQFYTPKDLAIGLAIWTRQVYLSLGAGVWLGYTILAGWNPLAGLGGAIEAGELVIGEEINPYSSYSSRSTLPFLEHASSHILELFPCLKEVRILRQWAGLCDMTPDYSPIISTVDEVEGYVVDVGWGTYGFKAGPIAGKMTAELIATNRTPDLIYPFRLSRFREEALVGEKAAAAVSH